MDHFQKGLITSFDLGAIYKRYPDIILKFRHIFIDHGAGPLNGIRGVRNGGLGCLVKGETAANARRLTINPSQTFILAPAPNYLRNQVKSFSDGVEVFSFHSDYVTDLLKPVFDAIQASSALASRKEINDNIVVDKSHSLKICSVLGFDELDASGISILEFNFFRSY